MKTKKVFAAAVLVAALLFVSSNLLVAHGATVYSETFESGSLNPTYWGDSEGADVTTSQAYAGTHSLHLPFGSLGYLGMDGEAFEPVGNYDFNFYWMTDLNDTITPILSFRCVDEFAQVTFSIIDTEGVYGLSYTIKDEIDESEESYEGFYDFNFQNNTWYHFSIQYSLEDETPTVGIYVNNNFVYSHAILSDYTQVSMVIFQGESGDSNFVDSIIFSDSYVPPTPTPPPQGAAALGNSAVVGLFTTVLPLTFAFAVAFWYYAALKSKRPTSDLIMESILLMVATGSFGVIALKMLVGA